MSIKISLLTTPGFKFENQEALLGTVKTTNISKTEQNQQFKNFEIQNGYGSATKVSVSPGYGATVDANISIEVNSITQETFSQIIEETKKSDSYKNNSSFRKDVDSYNYSSAGSSSSGIFGWLSGRGSSSYNNTKSNLTEDINNYNAGDSSSDTIVANSIANIMVKNTSKVKVTSTVKVTGQLLTPSPTVIAIESTVFSYTTEDGTTSAVTMINQTPLVPVDTNTGTVSSNTLAPGSKLTLTPIGEAALQN